MSRYHSCVLMLALAVLYAGPARSSEADPLPARKFPAVSKVILTSPESTIRSFVAALNARNLALAAKCVRGADSSNVLPGLRRSMGDIDGFELSGLKDTMTQQGATVTFRTVFIQRGRPTEVIAEAIQLVRTGKGWQISVSPDWDRKTGGAVLALATFIRYPEIGARAREVAEATTCMSNLKQIGTATMMFTDDYGGRYAFTESTVFSRIDPYVKSKAVYQCPKGAGTGAKYSFNGHLSGVVLKGVSDPFSTVLFYDGRNGRLAYRHGFGRLAGVAFADGHVQMVSASQAKTLVPS